MNLSESLTISKRHMPTYAEAELVINGELHPKAVRAFKSIFDEFSTNGLMSKDQCLEFTAKCLGSTSSPKYYSDKIATVYK
jgi:hypothetical protein